MFVQVHYSMIFYKLFNLLIESLSNTSSESSELKWTNSQRTFLLGPLDFMNLLIAQNWNRWNFVSKDLQKDNTVWFHNFFVILQLILGMNVRIYEAFFWKKWIRENKFFFKKCIQKESINDIFKKLVTYIHHSCIQDFFFEKNINT